MWPRISPKLRQDIFIPSAFPYLKDLVCWPASLNPQGNLLGNSNPIAFKRYHFFRVIGEDADIFKAKVDENLRANAAFVLDHALPRGLAVQLSTGMKMNLG